MRYFFACSFFVLCSYISAFFLPLQTRGGMLADLFILATAILLLVGTLRSFNGAAR